MNLLVRRSLKKQHTPGQIIILGFLLIIAVGAILLTLPISSKSGEFTPLKDAAFTSVSATCVTGLAVVDTMTYWSRFGQVVILLLIQIGGLGFMTMALLVSMFVRRKITPRERVIAAELLGLNMYGGTVRIAKRILIVTFTVEFVGAVILSTQFVPIFGPGEGIFMSVFHSVSAFCNAGFDLFGAYGGEFCSLAPFVDNVCVSLTIIALILIGGIGFIVWDDLIELVMHKKRIGVYSKIVLSFSAVLVFGGALAILLIEYNNPLTIGNMSFGNKLLASLFQSVTTRTAGFATIDNCMFRESSLLVSMLLMIVGGASGSTAGGVKVVTIFTVLWAALAASRGRTEVSVYKRRITHANIFRAISVFTIYIIVVFASTIVVSLSSGAGIIPAAYETISALSTVGLSLSLTGVLPGATQILLMFLMFFGRVGILTITYTIMMRMSDRENLFKYPDANLLIG